MPVFANRATWLCDFPLNSLVPSLPFPSWVTMTIPRRQLLLQMATGRPGHRAATLPSAALPVRMDIGHSGLPTLLQILLEALSLLLSNLLVKEHCKQTSLSSVGTSHSLDPKQRYSIITSLWKP